MRGGQQPSDSGSLDFLYIIITIVVAALLLWWKQHAAITHYVYIIRLFEIKAIYWLLYPLQDLPFFHDVDLHVITTMHEIQRVLNSGIYESLPIMDVVAISNDVGYFFIVPVLIIAVLLAGMLHYLHIGNKFRQSYSMKMIMNSESKLWSQLDVVRHLDLVKTDLLEGPWSMTLQPLEYAKKYKLLQRYIRDGVPAAHLKKDLVREHFSQQLGPYWQGLEQLPEHVLALFAIFSARLMGDKKGAQDLIDQICRTFAKGAANYTGSHQLIAKHVKDNKTIGRCVSPHAYVYTMMASLLELARINGVLATSEFIWLKVVDRRMWLILNCVGRQTAFVEVAAIFSHWQVEKRLRRPLRLPQINMAVDAFYDAVEEIDYNPDEDDDA